MTPTHLDFVAETLININGGLGVFQGLIKDKLKEDPTLLSTDPELLWLVARCAMPGRFKHTESWRKFLTRNFGFEFTNGPDTYQECWCIDDNTGDPKADCWMCKGKGKIHQRPQIVKVTHNGTTIIEKENSND